MIEADDSRSAAEQTQRMREAMSSVLGARASEQNSIDALRNGDEIFPAMLEAIREARRSIDFLTFVYWQGAVADAFADALSERARAGVEVRVLLDSWGSQRMSDGLIARMRSAGCDVRRFRGLDRWKVWQTMHRTHRKVLVCDERVGFTGGVGIASEWEGDARDETEWRDTHFRIRGPAVSSLRSGFLTNWIEDSGVVPDHDIDEPEEPVPSGDVAMHVARSQPAVGWTDTAIALRAFLKTAQRQVNITTAYFVPDADLTSLLCALAGRGVGVRVLVPGPHIDKAFVRLAGQDEYAPLLEAGAEIWEFQPTMLHTKSVTVDGHASLVGSANMNHRSLEHDDELSVIVYDPTLAAELDRHFEEDLERSEQIDRDRLADRSPVERVASVATRTVRRWF